jgi:uncharacterized beta-barrel protein YwiB (DUF1934 family)
MSEDININFKMNINNDDQKYEVQFSEQGKRYYKNQKTFIKFKEPLMHELEYNQLTLICAEDEMQIIRNGHVRMKQKYKENEQTVGYYNNDNLFSEIIAYTNKYDYSNENIYLNYDIILDNNIIGNYQMEVNIKGVNEG